MEQVNIESREISRTLCWLFSKTHKMFDSATQRTKVGLAASAIEESFDAAVILGVRLRVFQIQKIQEVNPHILSSSQLHMAVALPGTRTSLLSFTFVSFCALLQNRRHSIPQTIVLSL